MTDEIKTEIDERLAAWVADYRRRAELRRQERAEAADRRRAGLQRRHARKSNQQNPHSAESAENAEPISDTKPEKMS